MKRIIFIVVCLGIYFGALFIKDASNRSHKTDAPPTISSIRDKNGTPVFVEEAKKSTFKSFIRISGFINNKGEMTTEVTRDVISSIQSGEKAFIEFEGKKYEGHISSKSRSTNLLTGLYSIGISFDGIPLNIIGNIVVAHIPYKTVKNVLLVPRNAVSQREKEPYVYIVGDDKKLVKRIVKISNSNAEYFAISMGIAAGDLVVISDQRYLAAGEKVFYKN